MHVPRRRPGARPATWADPQYLQAHASLGPGPRHEDELAVSKEEDPLAMSCSASLPTTWACTASRWPATPKSGREDFRLLLDGPRAKPRTCERAQQAVEAGGTFGYRFHFPAMRSRPARGLLAPAAGRLLEPPAARPCAAGRRRCGYLTAYDADKPTLKRPLELWPRLASRPSIWPPSC